MNISIDLHGVIDCDPKGFEEYAQELSDDGHNVFILTGASYTDALAELAELKFNLKYIKKIISLTDYLLEKDLPFTYDKYNRPYFHDDIWWGAKACIAREQNINLHIDDCIQYQTTFTTPFLLYEGSLEIDKE